MSQGKPLSIATLQRAASATFGAVVIMALALPSSAAAASWRNHAPPFKFEFGNDFDSHQQTKEAPEGELSGFFYIKYTGQVTTEGLRVAQHVDCNAEPGCTAGWKLSGRSASAKYLNHADGDHPVFLIGREAIPQPGAYTHFHWRGAHPTKDDRHRSGFLLELQAIDTFCFVHHGDVSGKSGSCADFGGLKVKPGLDVSTHTNIVTSVEEPSTH